MSAMATCSLPLLSSLALSSPWTSRRSCCSHAGRLKLSSSSTCHVSSSMTAMAGTWGCHSLRRAERAKGNSGLRILAVNRFNERGIESFEVVEAELGEERGQEGEQQREQCERKQGPKDDEGVKHVRDNDGGVPGGGHTTATTRRTAALLVAGAGLSLLSPPQMLPPHATPLASPVASAAADALAVASAATLPATPPPSLLPLVPPGLPLAADLTPSAIIKGCWQLAGGHKGERDSDRTSGQAAVEDFDAFVSAGITTFDTADIYGPSEALIGRYLRGRGGPSQQPTQVLTKFCCFSPAELLSPSLEQTVAKIGQSKKNLGLPRLDLVQFYWHDISRKNYVQAAQYLADVQSGGSINHLGVTNFDTPCLQQIVDGGVKIVSSQVQFSLLDRRPLNSHLAFCQEHGISLLPFGTVAGGFLSDKYVGMSYEEARKAIKIDTYSKSKYVSVLGQAGGWPFLQDLLKALRQIGDKHGVSVANVATRWVLEQPQVSAVIVGARNANHVEDHQRLFTYKLDGGDYGFINEVLERYPKPKGDIYTWERGGMF